MIGGNSVARVPGNGGGRNALQGTALGKAGPRLGWSFGGDAAPPRRGPAELVRPVPCHCDLQRDTKYQGRVQLLATVTKVCVPSFQVARKGCDQYGSRRIHTTSVSVGLSVGRYFHLAMLSANQIPDATKERKDAL